jgi:hypothetical protein
VQRCTVLLLHAVLCCAVRPCLARRGCARTPSALCKGRQLHSTLNRGGLVSSAHSAIPHPKSDKILFQRWFLVLVLYHCVTDGSLATLQPMGPLPHCNRWVLGHIATDGSLATLQPMGPSSHCNRCILHQIATAVYSRCVQVLYCVRIVLANDAHCLLLQVVLYISR